MTEGAWDFSWAKRSMDVYNYGDRLVVHFTCKIEGSEENKTKLLADMQKWTKKNKVKKTAMEARWDENDPERFILAMTVAVDGKTKGEDIGKAYWEFIKVKSKKADEKLDDLIADW